jgi:hypothetical protein
VLDAYSAHVEELPRRRCRPGRPSARLLPP